VPDKHKTNAPEKHKTGAPEKHKAKEERHRGKEEAKCDRDRGDRDRGDRHRGDRDHGDKDRGRDPPATPRRAPPPSPQAVKPKDWRDEAGQNDDEDERDLSTDEEERDRKLAEARKRRQELMAKAGETEKTGARSEPESARSGAGEAGADQSTDKASDEPAPPVQPEAEDAGGSMFDDSAKAAEELQKVVCNVDSIKFTGASGEDWDDEEGYYVPKLGELMDERYNVTEVASGKGVYSGVVKAQDKKANDMNVAVKVIRANDRMTKAAELEVELLGRLNKADPKGVSYIIRLHDTFVYRKHFCLVFECMWGDMRNALKKMTKNRGMTLLAVRAFTIQLLTALKHMRNCKIVHSDIKPDNILITNNQNAVKFCDLGTAVEITGCHVTPYLGSGYYRSPEIVLGCEWGYPVDTWALGCTLFELFTGKILMPSNSNNEHLKKIMDLKGKIPGKVIKKGMVWKNHFTDNLDFLFVDVDKNTKEEVTRTLTDLSAKRSIKDLLMERVGPEKPKSTAAEDQQYVARAVQFADLLELMLFLDPDKRIIPGDALQHQFCQDLPAQKSLGTASKGKTTGSGRAK